MKFETASGLSAIKGVVHGFFTRVGGVSGKPFASLNCSTKVSDDAQNVHLNRVRSLEALSLPPTSLLVPNIIHGTNCVVVNCHSCPIDIAKTDADALITTDSHVSLGVTYADCLPILVAAMDGSIVGAIHAGWRGLRSGVIESTIETIFASFKECELVAAIGPGISQDAFTVSDEVWHYFRTTWPDFTVNELSCGRVDLSGIARQQLKRCGIHHVEKVGGFTDLDDSKYFSHRRDQGETGRHLAVIAKIQSRKDHRA